MEIYTKCILNPPDKESKRIRVSVMSRHTLNGGITPDTRITPDLYDVHCPLLGPSSELIRAWYQIGKNPPPKISWEVFEMRYLEEIRSLKKAYLVKLLAYFASRMNITLLCIEKSSKHCHRRLLAEECQRLQPSLEVIHR